MKNFIALSKGRKTVIQTYQYYRAEVSYITYRVTIEDVENKTQSIKQSLFFKSSCFKLNYCIFIAHAPSPRLTRVASEIYIKKLG